MALLALIDYSVKATIVTAMIDSMETDVVGNIDAA